MLVLHNNLCYNLGVKSLFRALHRHFIPSLHNGYQPHFLRLKTTAILLALILTIEVLYLAQTFIILPKSNSFAAIFASVLVDQTNENRLNEQLGTLTKNPLLERAAQMKADDMAAKGYFSHNSPDGKTPWYWFEQVGYDYAAAGENLAVNFTDSKDVTEAWMHSPAHRANIMNGNYTEIGIATAHGTYKGREAVFVVQEFGRPSLVAHQTPSQDLAITPTEIITPTPKASKESKPLEKPAITSIKRVERPTSSPDKISTTTLAEEKTIATPTTTIAGAETTKLNTPIALSAESVNAASPKSSSRMDTLLASPRRVTTILYLIVTAILLFALTLTVFIKVRIQYPHIIANGVLLVAIILSLVVLNATLGFTQGVI